MILILGITALVCIFSLSLVVDDYARKKFRHERGLWHELDGKNEISD